MHPNLETLKSQLNLRLDTMNWEPKPFIAGQTQIPVTAKSLDISDLFLLLQASLDLWLTSGRFTEEFENKIAEYLGLRSRSLFVNSGSSANLVAISSLFSPKLENALQPGDHILTCAASFPTTITPILQNGAVPIFCDLNPYSLRSTVADLEKNLTSQTRAVVLTHNLGIPFDAPTIQKWCRDRNLFFIEDSCDAFGSEIQSQKVGTFGDFSTLSFYPAHHITTGEGGAVNTNKPHLRKIAQSYRDWGRDCWCETGYDNTCKKRFDWDFSPLPQGYDHKYIYTHLGYNLKATDMQAALGVSQLDKMDQFKLQRARNYEKLLRGCLNSPILQKVLVPVTAPDDCSPNWFGFPILVQPGFDRKKIIRYIEDKKIATRIFFAGNITQQPLMKNQKWIADNLDGCDRIMKDLFWIGVHPLITDEMIHYMLDSLEQACRQQL